MIEFADEADAIVRSNLMMSQGKEMVHRAFVDLFVTLANSVLWLRAASKAIARATR